MHNLVFPDELRSTSRQDMAELYRKLRKRDPKIARLLFRREKEMLVRMKAILYGSELYKEVVECLIKK